MLATTARIGLSICLQDLRTQRKVLDVIFRDSYSPIFLNSFEKSDIKKHFIF